MRREWGSVQIKEALTSLSLSRPRSLLSRKAMSSRDSMLAVTQWAGGASQRSHSLHQWMDTSLGTPPVMSTCDRMHGTHMLAAFACAAGAPHRQHRIVLGVDVGV